jgi:hypothetical protein
MTRSTRPIACKISHEEYSQIDGINWSTLKYADESALSYLWHLENPPAETPAMVLGRATHTAVLESDRLLHEYVIFEGDRRGNDWKAFKEMHRDKTILRPEEYDTAIRIRDAVHGHKVAKKLLAKGLAECTLRWVDPPTGLACKARLDWLDSRTLVDLKTTRNLGARDFGRSAGGMGYHGQLAFINMGLATFKRKVKTYLIAVENDEPHDVGVFTVSEDDLWAGEQLVRRCLDLVAECRRTKKWPGRYPAAVPLELPTWYFPKDEDELSLADLGLVPRPRVEG